jgi:hypothetical protein
VILPPLVFPGSTYPEQTCTVASAMHSDKVCTSAVGQKLEDF